MDAFELASDNMPLIGFSANEDLKKEFRVKLNPAGTQKQTRDIHLSLEVLPESRFRESYQTLEFWIDRKFWLPVRVDAITAEGDITRIRFLRAKVNEKVDAGLFSVQAPQGWKPEIIPLNPN
jgi:outer membrane lipoprotein-sorting protein